jgi:hypothetical protein
MYDSDYVAVASCSVLTTLVKAVMDVLMATEIMIIMADVIEIFPILVLVVVVGLFWRRS